MELNKIIGELHDYKPQVISLVPEPVYIQTHKMIKPNQDQFFSGCLYVGYVSDLPASLSPDSPTSLICICNTPLPAHYQKVKNLNLILMDYGTNQYDVLNQIADIMIDEALLTSNMRILLDALYSDLGLQHLVDVAFEAFGNPIFVNDTAYKILAMSQKAVFNDPTLEAEKSLGYIHEANVAALKRDRTLELTSESNYPFYSKKSEDTGGWLFRTVKIHNIVVGDVALVENNRPFRRIDYELLERFSKLIALEMEKNDFYKDNKGVMVNYFLADLLSEKMQNMKAISQRLTYLNWKVFPYFQVLIVFDHKTRSLENKIQGIGQQLQQILPDCHWTNYDGKVVAVLSRPSDSLLTAFEKQALEDFIHSNHLSIGLSNTFTDILTTRKYFLQAVNAAELGFEYSKENGLFSYCDLVIAHIGKIISADYDLQEFFHPAIQKIRQYDLENHSNLLNTLREYLRYLDDPKKAAEQLFIHRNTLQYRINKIKELACIDLIDGDERLKLQLSLELLDLLENH